MHGLVVCPSVPGSNPNSFLAPPLTDILSVTKKSLETSNFLVKNEDQKELNFHRISCSVTTWNRNDRHENQKHPSGPLNSVFFLASFSRSSWNSILCSTQMVLCPAKAIRTGSVPCVLRLLPDSCMVTGAAPCKQHPAKSADPEGQLRILGIQASDAENNSEFAIKYGKIIFFFLAKKSNWTGELWDLTHLSPKPAICALLLQFLQDSGLCRLHPPQDTQLQKTAPGRPTGLSVPVTWPASLSYSLSVFPSPCSPGPALSLSLHLNVQFNLHISPTCSCCGFILVQDAK